MESGDTIHDVIRFVDEKAPVNMIGTGWVASAGALIFAAGHRDRRFCLPNTRFLLHQPAGGVRGPASDIDIEAKEILKMRERLNHLFAKVTGRIMQKSSRIRIAITGFLLKRRSLTDLSSRVISQMSELTR